MPLKMTFLPSEPGNMRQMLAAFAYQAIWQEDGERIQAVFYEVTGLKFRQRHIRAKIVPGKASAAGLAGLDMTLAAEEYTHDQKRTVLVHELAHRLLGGNRVWIRSKNKAWKYYVHYWIDLFLYEAWVMLYGKEFADTGLKHEINLGRFYAKAWKNAMAMSPQDRRLALDGVVARRQKIYGHESLW